MGRYEDAESLHTHALAIRQQQLGANHPDTAISLHNLAGLYWAMGRYEDAIRCLHEGTHIENAILVRIAGTFPETQVYSHSPRP
jgi:tetratricopeptide (TPR) repeat protein